MKHQERLKRMEYIKSQNAKTYADDRKNAHLHEQKLTSMSN